MWIFHSIYFDEIKNRGLRTPLGERGVGWGGGQASYTLPLHIT